MSSIVSEPNYTQVSEFDIEIAILSKNSDIEISLPPYLYRDNKNTLRATETNRRAFRGIGSVEVIDSHNEIVDIEAIRKVMDIMIKEMGGTLLYNHQNLRMGTILGWGDCTVFDEKLKKTHPAIFIDFEVFDNYQTHRDVIEMMDLPDDHPDKIGMLSIGGRKMKKVRECNATKCYDRVTEIEGHEYSLVKKGSNQFAFILEKTAYTPFGDGIMEVSKPQDQDQSAVTLDIPDETVDPSLDPLNKMMDHKKMNQKKDKVKKMEDKEDKEDDEDMDKMDEEEDKDEKDEKDDKLEKVLNNIVDTLEKVQCRLAKMEDTNKIANKSTESVKKTVTVKGNTYILQKTSNKEISKLNKRIEALQKGDTIIPAQSTPIQHSTPEEISPLKKRKEEISKMSIDDRVTFAMSKPNRHRRNLERMGIHIQN